MIKTELLGFPFHCEHGMVLVFPHMGDSLPLLSSLPRVVLQLSFKDPLLKHTFFFCPDPFVSLGVLPHDWLLIHTLPHQLHLGAHSCACGQSIIVCLLSIHDFMFNTSFSEDWAKLCAWDTAHWEHLPRVHEACVHSLAIKAHLTPPPHTRRTHT